MAARVINADVGTRALTVSLSGFDTHAAQLSDHALYHGAVDEAIEAFFTALAPAFRRRVTMVVVSEFGRRPAVNGGLGTDHGNAGLAMVIGDNVKGGLLGAQPSLTTFDAAANLVPAVDFRSLYASLLSGWLAADDRAILGATYERLDLFRAGPGAVPA
jgi:uncharacterized protein (DUF1501 family)